MCRSGCSSIMLHTYVVDVVKDTCFALASCPLHHPSSFNLFPSTPGRAAVSTCRRWASWRGIRQWDSQTWPSPLPDVPSSLTGTDRSGCTLLRPLLTCYVSMHQMLHMNWRTCRYTHTLFASAYVCLLSIMPMGDPL